ncbi:50S ribosomal protein L17 [Candidatus Berkelbacteria bacterium]|nr:50S ribosomal protein L17 [Candidatus Berkelbacteria bacterium]
MRTLSRKKANRERLLRNLTTSVILYERIKTTHAKAKETQRWIDYVINLGKRNDLASRRRLLGWVLDRNAAKKIWDVLRERYAQRPSGYSRTIPLGQRVGDAAQVVFLELVDTSINLPAPSGASATAAKDETTVVAPKNRPSGLTLSRKKATVTVRSKKATKAIPKVKE